MRIPTVLKGAICGIPIWVTIVDQVGYVARVDGISMQPVLNPDLKQQDYVFLSRWAMRNYNVKRGDVVSLVSPKEPDLKLIKRVVGVPGDVISTLYYKKRIVKVPDGHCWVEGDHIGHSLDSNNFGPVCLGLVTARAACIVWPPSRWQWLQSSIPDSRIPLNLTPASSIL